MIEEVSIPARFNGPVGSANGGYACGVVADAIGPSACVNLLRPPPLSVPLRRRRTAVGVELLDGEVTVAEGHAARPFLAPPEPPTLSAVIGASAQHLGRWVHAFPTCFVCGPQRAVDGMGLCPGPLGDGGLLVCPWAPDLEFAGARFAWAALDCPAGLACMPPGSRTVLASMTATVEAAVLPGHVYIVTAWPVRSEGRKHWAGSALYEADGVPVAWAESLWITLSTV